MTEKLVALTYDPEADAAYVYLTPRGEDRRVARNRLCRIEELERAAITVDFDDGGKILGFEVLGASRLLPQTLISD